MNRHNYLDCERHMEKHPETCVFHGGWMFYDCNNIVYCTGTSRCGILIKKKKGGKKRA